MKKFYLHNGHETIGPFDREDLYAQKINNETLVWSQEMITWKKAGEVNELKVILQTTPLPPPLLKKKTQVNQYKKARNRNFNIYLLIAIVLIACMAIGYTMLSEKKQSNQETSIPADDSIQRHVRNNITSLVKVTNNQYAVSTFGGISNLDVIVSNNTDYTLDQVTVAIDYIKKNGGIYKTETLTFNNIPAKQNISLSAPNSKRGLAVKLTMQTITALELSLCYEYKNTPAVGNPDPYNCNQHEKNNPDHVNATIGINRSLYLQERR